MRLSWSWTAAFAFVALASITGSMFCEGVLGELLLGAGIFAATLAVTFQLVGTFRIGHTH